MSIEGRQGADGNTVKTPEQHRQDRAKKRQAKEQAKLQGNPDVAAAFGQFFDGMPDISVWGESGWASFSD